MESGVYKHESPLPLTSSNLQSFIISNLALHLNNYAGNGNSIIGLLVPCLGGLTVGNFFS